MHTAKLQWINGELLVCEAELSELTGRVWLGAAYENIKDWDIGSTLVFQLLSRLKEVTGRLIGYSQDEKDKIMKGYIDKVKFFRESEDELDYREWNEIVIQYALTEGVVKIGNYKGACVVVEYPWDIVTSMFSKQSSIAIDTISALQNFLFKLFDSMNIGPLKKRETNRLANAFVLTFFNSVMTDRVVHFRFDNFLKGRVLSWTMFETFMTTRAAWADYYEVDYKQTRNGLKDILSRSIFECNDGTYTWRFDDSLKIEPKRLRNINNSVYYIETYHEPQIPQFKMQYCIPTFDDLYTYIYKTLKEIFPHTTKTIKDTPMTPDELSTITLSMLLTHFDKLPA